MANQEQSMYEKNLFNKRYQNQENKAAKQQEHGLPGESRQETAKNRQGETVQASLTQTADQIQKQVQQATEMKLQNSGVYEKSDSMKKMLSGNNQAYMQGQSEVAKAFAAGEKNAKDYDAMQLNTDKHTSMLQDAAKAVTDDILFTAAQTISNNKSINKSKFGMEDSENKAIEKTLSSASRMDRPQASGKGKVLTSPVVDDGNVIKGGTSFEQTANTQSDDSGIIHDESVVINKPVVANDKASGIPMISVYFVPDFDTKGHTGKAASKGRTAMVDAVRFKPVVYVLTDIASSYKEIKSDYYQVQDGMTQVDAFDYAKKNGCTLADIMKNDNNYVEMMNNASIAKSSFPLKLSRYQSMAGDAVSPFATMTSPYQGYVASVYGQGYNADAFAAATYAVDKDSPKVKDMLETSYQTSVDNDRAKYPQIYDEIDTANEYVMAKKNIMNSDSYSDKRLKYKAVLDLDNDYVNAQKIRYENSGFPTDEISVLEKIGQIGIDSIEIKTLLKTDITPESIYSEYNQPVANSGVFTITSDSYKNTNFGQYLKQHQADINGYIGDSFGYADDDKNAPSINVVDAGRTANGRTSCAIVYTGFDGESTNGKSFDEVAREAISSSLIEYGDSRARISKNTYSATQNEINYAGSYVSPYKLNVPIFDIDAENVKSTDKQVTLDASLSAGYDAAKENGILPSDSMSMQ